GTPADGDVDVSIGDGAADLALRIRLGVVAVDRIATHVLDEMTRGERLRGGRVLVVLAGDLDADGQILQPRVVERGDLEVPIAARDERIGRAIVRTRRLDEPIAVWHADDHVAPSLVALRADDTTP